MSSPSSDTQRALLRIGHMLSSIANIRRLLNDQSLEIFVANADMRAACERYLEILSEASRHVPEVWRVQHGSEVPWRRVFDLGNVLRHAYHTVDAIILWEIYESDLDPLQIALEAMLQTYHS
jgi:uncharacterized protein with HEPN domain